MAEKLGDIYNLKPPRAYQTPAPPVIPGIAQDDPMYAVVAGVQAIQTHTLKELGGLVQKLSDDIAATAVTAEQAATAKAEAVVTQAGSWASDQIREAGRQTASQVIDLVTELRDVVESAKNVVESAKNWLTALILVLGANGLLLIVTLWLLLKANHYGW